MSKLQVKTSRIMSTTSKSERRFSVNVQSAIDEGGKINYVRCSEPTKAIAPHFHKKSKCIQGEGVFRVSKIVFPPKPKYPRCAHEGNFLLDRSLLTRKHHEKILAQPKQVSMKMFSVIYSSNFLTSQHFIEQYPRWVDKTIEPASCALNQLAQPRTLRVLTTFDEHLHHMSICQIEHFLDKIFKVNYQTPEQAIRMIKQTVNDRKMRIQRQRREIKSLRKCLNERKKDVGCLTTRFIDNIRTIMSSNEPTEADGEAEKYSDVILARICQLMKQPLPQEGSKSLIDRLLCSFAEKISYCMAEILDDDDRTNNSEENRCVDSDTKKCFAIKDFYPHVPLSPSTTSEVDVEEADEVVEQVAEDAKHADEAVSNQLLSFLRKSQINIDLDKCQQLTNIVEDLKKAKMIKNEEKVVKKAAKKVERAKAKKLYAAKKYKASSGDSKECLGNVDQKPQWEVEWIDK